MTIKAQDAPGARTASGSWGLASDGVNTWVDLEGNGFANVAGGELELNSGSVSSKVTLGGTSANQDITVNAQRGLAANTIGVIGRVGTASNFYYLVVGNSANTLSLGKRSSGSYTDLGTASFTNGTGVKYAFRLRMVGTTLQGKAWIVGNTEPGWMITLTDSTFTTGNAGVFVDATAGATNAILDNFIYTDAVLSAEVEARSTFKVKSGQVGESRSMFRVSSILNSRARAGFLVRVAQVVRARSSFKTRILLGGVARSTFKISGSIHNLVLQARAAFKVKAGQRTEGNSTFKIAQLKTLLTQSRSVFKVRSKQTTEGRSNFLIPLVHISTPLRASFSILQKLTSSFSSIQKITSTISTVQSLTATFRSPSMPQPNSTIQTSATVRDNTGALLSNLSSVNVTLSYPDGSSSVVGLGSGVVNAGSGVYTVLYQTKMPGLVREEWKVIASDGTTLADFMNIVPVSY